MPSKGVSLETERHKQAENEGGEKMFHANSNQKRAGGYYNIKQNRL